MREQFSQWILSAIETDIWQVFRFVFPLIKRLPPRIIFYFFFSLLFVKRFSSKRTQKPRRNEWVPLHLAKKRKRKKNGYILPQSHSCSSMPSFVAYDNYNFQWILTVCSSNQILRGTMVNNLEAGIFFSGFCYRNFFVRATLQRIFFKILIFDELQDYK